MKKILDLYNIEISKIRCTFLGRPVAQSFAAFFLFEKILLENKFKRIVELGTWKGNLSLYFLLYCLSENAEFYTYDIYKLNSYIDCKQDKLKSILEFEKYFKLCDIFLNKNEIKHIIQKEGRTFLFCDNGHKKQEFNVFVPFLKVDDIVGVHDWEIEIKYEDIKEIIKKENLEMIFEDECKKNDNYLRFFKKIK